MHCHVATCFDRPAGTNAYTPGTGRARSLQRNDWPKRPTETTGGGGDRDNMDLRLSDDELSLQRRARAFTDEVLVPLELECEEHNGLLPESATAAKRQVLERGFNGINHDVRNGGQGLDLFEQMLVEEQWGRATGALWDLPWRPSIPLAAGTDEQRERFLRPAVRGERRDAYAITEANAGSDPSMVATTAVRDGAGWIVRGEKWHVTSGDVADFFLVHAHVDGDPAKATIFLLDKDAPGVRLVRTPRYMHTFVFEHPIYAFDDVRVGGDRVLGAVGQGFELTKDWFVEERLMIGARTVGAATRALDESLSFARDREQFGSRIVEFQAIQFMLADMSAEIMAAKSMLYRACWEAARGGVDRKRVHALASAVKLVCSETAGRVADRAVQIHGGRGYMREYAVERLWRELRVDRIWEGTSEIQRLVIGNEVLKRGADTYTGWPLDAIPPGSAPTA
jgi:alkylation response protein AidB-like acyl-CoA dehydrogenase